MSRSESRGFSALASSIVGEYRERTKLVALSVWVLLLLTVAYLALVRPNGSHITNWLNDVMGLTDAAYRTYLGQIPSIDFYSIYGIAVYFPAALGFHFGLNASEVLAFGHFVVALFLLPLAAITVYRRFSILPSFIFVLYVFLLIVAPTEMGGFFLTHTFGTYYNRHCYAALAIVLLHYVEPRSMRRTDSYLDAAVLTLLLLFLVYSKTSFGGVALGFVIANALTSKWKLRTMAVTLAACVVLIGAIGMLTHYNSAYLADNLAMAQAKGSIFGGVHAWIRTLYAHMWDVVGSLLALIALSLSRRFSVFDSAFVMGTIFVSFALRDLTGGGLLGLPLLVAVFLCCGELARRTVAGRRAATTGGVWPEHAGALAVFGLLLVFVSEPIMGNSLALFTYYLEVRKPPAAVLPGLAGYVFPPESDSGDGFLHNQLGHDDQAHRLLATVRQMNLRAGDYWPLIIEGCHLLERVDFKDHAVVSFEQTNPFEPLMGMRPTSYGFPLLWVGAAFTEKKHPAPARYFSDADYVMVPAVPYSQSELDLLLKIYGSYLHEHYEVVQQSPHWSLWALKKDRGATP